MQKITTIVCYHDLLGYGDMISVSGGTLDSAVGRIAYQRINTLRRTLGEVKKEFPSGTAFFQLNDTAVAVFDLDFKIETNFIDPDSILPEKIDSISAKKLLNFICGSEQLHCETIKKDYEGKVGPAGRTFIVLGERWANEEYSDGITGVPELQTNLAFAEAYLADQAGSKAGFNNLPWQNVYLNDSLWVCLKELHRYIPREINALNRTINPRDGKNFPGNILIDQKETRIFNRKRKFYSINCSASNINNIINQLNNSVSNNV